MYQEKYAQKVQIGAGASQTISSTGLAAYSYTLMENARITRIMAYVTTAVVSSAPAVIQVLLRPINGSATGQTVIGTLSIPGGTVVDKILYKDVTPVNANLGDQIVFNVLTAATSSGAAFYDVVADYDPEVPANQSKMVLSA